jgi:hypothetical protein
MRRVFGELLLPGNVPTTTAKLVLVEVRDTTLMDVASEVVAEQRIQNVTLVPNGRIRFDLEVPEVDPSQILTLRAHVDIAGEGRVSSGDLLTVTLDEVPSRGDFGPVELSLRTI